MSLGVTLILSRLVAILIPNNKTSLLCLPLQPQPAERTVRKTHDIDETRYLLSIPTLLIFGKFVICLSVNSTHKLESWISKEVA